MGRTRKPSSGEADSNALYEESPAESRVGLAQKKSGNARLEESSCTGGKEPFGPQHPAAMRVAGGVNRSGLYYEPAGENEEEPPAHAVAGRAVHAGRRSMGVEKMTEWLVTEG